MARPGNWNKIRTKPAGARSRERGAEIRYNRRQEFAMFIIVMGVSGCGKTTIGARLAERLGWPFYDGDDFHPARNVEKMASGQPLDDHDRAGWLARLADLIRERSAAGQDGVLACSALKEAYRELLRGAAPGRTRFVYLKGSYEVILARMELRDSHFMPPAMLQSQFDSLEEPAGALTIAVTLPPAEIVQIIIAQTRAAGG
jgi:gluconokinase